MNCSVYKINKGVNKPIEFRGLKAQYIWWLAGGLVGLMVGFAILYIIGISPYICVGLVLLAGAALFIYVYKLSNAYGEHGMMKKLAKRNVPKSVTCNSRKIFMMDEVDDESTLNSKF
jgi:hypothetical protein